MERQRLLSVAARVRFLHFLVLVSLCESLSSSAPAKFVVLGGSGRIGTAVATHLLFRAPESEVILVGRRPDGSKAVEEVLRSNSKAKVSYQSVCSVWDKDSVDLQNVINSADCVIHTAGPYLDRKPVPLELAIASKRCRAYVDLSDPLPYLEASLLMDQAAKDSKTTALIAAGAFPGMSNVFAREAASHLDNYAVKDVRFNYFTAGLGGSGDVNLYITNLGFGEPMVQYDGGHLRFFQALSGLLLGKVDFFIPSMSDGHAGNDLVKKRVGTKTIFAWPFPEAATAATALKARGSSYAAMGTAPDVWNGMLGILVDLIPRAWWRNGRFSQFLADFSQPLVRASDAYLKWTGTGQTHAMRVDVTAVAEGGATSIVQAHDSFRHCVGQSCAEFALDVLRHPDDPGVFLSEQRYDGASDRKRIIGKLTMTPGTFCYTGPVKLDTAPQPPTGWFAAIQKANEAESLMGQKTAEM